VDQQDSGESSVSNEIDLFANAGDGLTAQNFGVDEHGRAFVEAPAMARAMGYRQTKNALDQLDDEEKGFALRETPGGNQRISVIFEDGIWELIFRSTLPSAKSIKARVKTILRQLRETGVVDTREVPGAVAEFDPTNLRHVAQLATLAATQQDQLTEQAPLVAQAESHRAGFRDVTRQEFAREVVTWGEQQNVVIKHQHVFAFLVHIGLFVAPNRSDSGHAKTDAIRRGLAVTAKGTTEGGRNYATGKLTPKGQGYVWDRIVRHVEANGTLELPRRIGEAS
jgi:prophage antirepressor-like protein